MKKVYCKDCRYLLEGHLTDYTGQMVHICSNPKNCGYHTVNESFFEPEHKVISHYENVPSEINKHNDCEWFERKE